MTYYYEVAPVKIIRSTSDVFTYSCESLLTVGQIVSISIGTQSLTGVIMNQVPKPAYATKGISDIYESLILPTQLVTTARWMSGYYATHLATVLQTILPRGVTTQRRSRQSIEVVPSRKRTHFVFTDEQTTAIDTISEMSPGTAILHGVTGSGKTAVYIKIAQQAVSSGRSVIVLVPEIALTSQLVADFANHFDDILVAHSKQTEAQRHSVWLSALHSTKPRIVIGPRSALFIPVPNPAYVMIDEAHEPAYKQEQSPRYSALRVASVLMGAVSGKVVQGSATPLISEYYLAQQAKRPVIEMNQRAQSDVSPPLIKCIDMTKKTNFITHRFFSDELLSTISASLASGDQVLVYHNRRGSASTTLCQQCGWFATCPRCFISYTLHADLHTLSCHVCANKAQVPTSCPDCHSTDIIHRGIGTKLIETELKKLFPKYHIARFDGDTSTSDTLEKRYAELYSGDIRIIVGTQVIAKGLDLPHLRTVCVVQADAGLALPDYMASERTFQLLAQVVGRVGRSSSPSSVVVQSYQPNSPIIQLGLTQRYDDFLRSALGERQRAHFPPFTHMLQLTCSYKTEQASIRNAQKLGALLKSTYGELVQILGPTPSFYERQRDMYRWQIVVRASRRQVLVDIASTLPQHWQFDLDPMSLL